MFMTILNSLKLSGHCSCSFALIFSKPTLSDFLKVLDFHIVLGLYNTLYLYTLSYASLCCLGDEVGNHE